MLKCQKEGFFEKYKLPQVAADDLKFQAGHEAETARRWDELSLHAGAFLQVQVKIL